MRRVREPRKEKTDLFALDEVLDVEVFEDELPKLCGEAVCVSASCEG